MIDAEPADCYTADCPATSWGGAYGSTEWGATMPIVRIDMLAGRTPERKAELIRRVTEAVAATLEVQPEQVRVLLAELPPEHWGVGGRSMAERATPEGTQQRPEVPRASAAPEPTGRRAAADE